MNAATPRECYLIGQRLFTKALRTPEPGPMDIATDPLLKGFAEAEQLDPMFPGAKMAYVQAWVTHTRMLRQLTQQLRPLE